MSGSNKNIYADFVKSQKEFEKAFKDGTNPHFRSKYASLASCIEAVKEALNNNGIAFIQKNHDCDHGIAIETIFIHESGESLSNGILRVPAVKNDPQGYGSAMTYARRYSLMAACGIAPEDDDGNNASQNQTKQKPLLEKKVDELRSYQSKLKDKSKEEIVLDGEKACSMGTDGFRSWYTTLNQIEKDFIKDKIDNFKLKCKESDDFNQYVEK